MLILKTNVDLTVQEQQEAVGSKDILQNQLEGSNSLNRDRKPNLPRQHTHGF